MLQVLKALFDLSGTASRRKALAVLALMICAFVVGTVLMDRSPPDVTRFAMPAFGFITIYWIATLVRRLHDAGRSGLWILVTFVPLLGAIAVLVITLLPRRASYEPGPNLARSLGTGMLGLYAVMCVLRIFWQPFWIPSEADKPTLLVGDYVLARLSGPGDYPRGTMIVLRHPVDGREYIKRIVALPGERVQMRGGVLFINDVAAVQEPSGTFTETMEPQGPNAALPRCANGPVGLGGICEKALLRETLPGGPSHEILDIEADGFFDNTDVFTLPDGHVFVMGDNRDNSNDSRFAVTSGGIGFVPTRNIVGRVDRVIFSSAGRSLLYVWTWRADRFFKAVE